MSRKMFKNIYCNFKFNSLDDNYYLLRNNPENILCKYLWMNRLDNLGFFLWDIPNIIYLELKNNQFHNVYKLNKYRIPNNFVFRFFCTYLLFL